jgi:tetratricopeptide (TPR) repeat protein
VKHPPLWLQRGFALYFEKCVYDEDTNYAIYRENLSWLPTLKQIIQNSIDFSEEDGKVLIPLQTLLNPDTFTTENQKDIFYAQSWGFITFLEGSTNKDYNRLLWDSMRTIRDGASLEENEQAVKKTILNWVNENLLFSDFISFINSMKTFPEMVKAGVEAYSNANYDEAEELFIQAVVLDANHNLPYYYLGLIHYARKDYSLAEYYYQSALMLGTDPALIYFALGLNAFADGRIEDAGSYLKEARAADPDTYLEKTEDLLLRIENMSISLDTTEGE